MAEVILIGVSKDYEGSQKNKKKNKTSSKAVDNINFVIPEGSFTVVVGPSGCGKSTTLRMIAGLEEISEGEVWIGDRMVNHVKPGERNVSMVFQNYALYPTMSVYQNISFGLENQGIKKAEIEKRVRDVAKLVDLEQYLDRKPSNLSGGQRQRVALARAIVKRPDIYIFDEPLSNLDAKLRSEMRSELIKMHDELKTTFIYVTHDQVEAMSMADQIILLNHGKVMQIGSPMELYHNPQNTFVATFMGTPAMNIVKATTAMKFQATIIHRDEYFGYRPEKAILDMKPIDGMFCIKSKVMTKEMLGSEILYKVENMFGEQNLKSTEEAFQFQDHVYVNVSQEDLYFFDREGNRMEASLSNESGKESDKESDKEYKLV
ncbi:ABC transporter ATP-binding protein [bacterium LRH843]|nr:ABC transporter ATP-binding protein [bacterium LRH843]